MCSKGGEINFALPQEAHNVIRYNARPTIENTLLGFNVQGKSAKSALIVGREVTSKGLQSARSKTKKEES